MTWDRVSDDRIKTLDERIRDDVTAFINDCEGIGIYIRVTQVLRTKEEQDSLYYQGRDKDGNIIDKSKVVTNVKYPMSWHNHGLAFDICEIRDRKSFWDIDYEKIVPLAKNYGFEWGGDFKNFKDKPHFQKTFGKTIIEMIEGIEYK